MKYEHRDHISLVAVTDNQGDVPTLLLNLNPSLFTFEELVFSQVTVRDELKRLASYAIGKDSVIQITPGLYICVLNIRTGKTSFTKFSMTMNPDIFREYKDEVQAKFEAYFGMEPEVVEKPMLQVATVNGEATPAYVNQDR